MRGLIVFLCLVIASASASAQSAADMQRQVLEKDFALMMEWFPGRWDNEAQVFFDADLKTPPEARNGRIHSIFMPVALPAFGQTVFYVQQYADGDFAKIYRQRIYVFAPDPAENAIKLTIFTPKDAARLKDAHLDPKKLEGLTPTDAETTPGCEVYWRRQANQFVGYMKPKACRVVSRRDGRPILITDDLVLTPDELWIRDRAETEAGEYVFGNKAGVHHKLRKARPFSCWVSVLRGAKHGDAGEDSAAKNWFFKRGVSIHDQGGLAEVTTDESPPRTLRLRLRDVAWPYGSNRPSLTLYVLGEGSDRAVSYAWNDGGADRVGINLRWMQASCTRDEAMTWTVR